MPDLSTLEELWRRSLDLNVRYYGAVGRLTADYFRDLATVLSGLNTSQPPGARDQPADHSARGDKATDSSTSNSTAGTMVLEGEAGGTVLGVFLVENNLGREISATVVASPFADASGRTIQPAMKFDPESIVLRSGEQLLVRVMALIEETLEPEVRYLGQFTIPGLTGTRVPVVLRRRRAQEQAAPQQASEDVPPTATAEQPVATATRKSRAGKGKASPDEKRGTG